MPKASTGAVGGTASGARAGGAIAAGAAGGAAAAFLQGGGAAARPAAGARPGVENRAGTAATARADARTDRRTNAANNRPDRTENRQQRSDNRVQRRDEVRNQVRDNHPWAGFWADHPGWAAMRITRPYRWATWGALTGWFGGGYGGEPASYDYGSDVYYEGDTVHAGEQTIPAEEYTQQAEQIVDSAPEVPADKAEWLSLGVFAMTQDGQATGPDPSLFLQLAVSKEGVLRGTFNNSATGQTQGVEGMVDKKSQRAAWTVAGKSRPIMETGLGNLTQDTGSALVHFDDGSTQQWLLVRLEEPPAEK